HPAGPAAERIERAARIGRRVREAACEAVHGVAVRPVALHGDRRELVALDQPARDRGPPAIELGRAMGGLSEQNEAAVADPLQKGLEVGFRAEWVDASR